MTCYLDANATTFMHDLVIKSMIKWTNKGNASSHYASAKESKALIETFTNLILKDNGILDTHIAILNSGASECNSHIITSAVRSFMTKTGHLPHLIISSIEHKSITMCCESLQEDGLCKFSIVDVQTAGPGYGMVDPVKLEALIRPNTCLISIMSANNETGIRNDITQLAAIAHKHKIPFHTDCVQSFGKYGIIPTIDACSISFHKLYGPPGIGCLIIRKTFLEGYGLKALICGTQNNSLRGGTENIPAIGASFAAYKLNMIKRKEKNDNLLEKKRYLKSILSQKISCYNILEFNKQKKQKNKLFWIENDENKTLPNTLLLAVYMDNFCNIKMKEELEKCGVIISIGSACNTNNPDVSYVISNMSIPEELRSGILRLSMQDDITEKELLQFATAFFTLLRSDLVKL